MSEVLNRDGSRYFGGVPTDIDIRRLRDAFPDSDLTVGRLIPYERVAEIIGHAVASNRFKTVTARWRRLIEKDAAVIIGTEAGKGFKVLDNREMLDVACGKQRSAVKSVKRSFHVAGYVERKSLPEEDQRRYDILAARGASMMLAARLRGKPTEFPKLSDAQPSDSVAGKSQTS